ncbi:MAG: hypothetical protein R2806_21090 [Saprospiraceae bacterium]
MKSSTSFIWPRIGHFLFLVGGISGLMIAGLQMANRPVLSSNALPQDTITQTSPLLQDPAGLETLPR